MKKKIDNHNGGGPGCVASRDRIAKSWMGTYNFV